MRCLFHGAFESIVHPRRPRYEGPSAMVSDGLIGGALPPALVERLRERGAVLVAGLGCSSLAGLPGWPETLRRIAACLRGEEGRAARRVVEDLLGRGRRAAAL